MQISEAVSFGFLKFMEDEKYQPSTISLYLDCMQYFIGFVGDLDVKKIDQQMITRFFAHLETGYETAKAGKGPAGLSTRKNFQKSVHLFFSWAEKNLGVKSRPDRFVKLPKGRPDAIRILSTNEYQILMQLLTVNRQADTNKRSSYTYIPPTLARMRALVLLILDTGLEPRQVCELQVRDFNSEQLTLTVDRFPNHVKGKTSHSTQRTCYITQKTCKAIEYYLSGRSNIEDDLPLLANDQGETLTSNAIRMILRGLGKKAGIELLNAQVLRDTFIVEYLRKTNDVANLKVLLGKKQLSSLKRYQELAALNLQDAHKIGSPVANWLGPSEEKPGKKMSRRI